MDTHHCPRCELRFVHTSELRQHVAVDHGVDPGTFERFRYHAGPTSAPTPRRTLVLVANQTLADEAVLDQVAARLGDGDRLLVVVPAHRTGRTDEAGTTIARWRLDAALERLGTAGVTAEGRIEDADPFVAVTHVLAEEQVDEIVVSTLPASASHWLNVDLPGQLRRHTHRPVSVLTPVPAGD